MKTEQTKKSSPASFILPALVALVALVPVVYMVLLSFVDYHPAAGLWNSPAAGFRHYAAFLTDYFPRLLRNALTLSLTSLLASLILGVLAALLCSLIRNRRIAAACAGLLLLPAFIPAPVYYNLALQLLTSTAFVLNDRYLFSFIAQTFLPGAAPIAFAGTLAGIVYRSRGKSAQAGALTGSLGAALIFGFLSVMPSFETTQLSANPLVYEAADTLDSLIFRNSVLNGQISGGAAAFIIRCLLQILLAVIPAILLWFWLKKQRSLQTAEPATGSAPAGGKKTALAAVPWLIAAAACIGLLLVYKIPLFSALPDLAANLTTSLATLLIAGLIGGLFSLAILSGVSRAGSLAVIILAVLLLATSNALLGQYLLSRQFGLVNTLFPTALTLWLQPQSLLLIFVFALALRYRGTGKAALLLSACSACFIGAQAFGGSIPAMLYLSTPNRYTMGLMLVNTMNAQPDTTLGWLALVYAATLLPCLLLGFVGAVFARQAAIELAK